MCDTFSSLLLLLLVTIEAQFSPRPSSNDNIVVQWGRVRVFAVRSFSQSLCRLHSLAELLFAAIPNHDYNCHNEWSNHFCRASRSSPMNHSNGYNLLDIAARELSNKAKIETHRRCFVNQHQPQSSVLHLTQAEGKFVSPCWYRVLLLFVNFKMDWKRKLRPHPRTHLR